MIREIKCKYCLKTFTTYNNKFCSRKCYYNHQKENEYMGRFKNGHKLNVGENNSMWKGDKACYGSIHDWVKRRLGSPKKCKKCGNINSKKYEWANISGQYKRDLKDFIRLCVSCHRKKDNHSKKMWITRRKYA